MEAQQQSLVVRAPAKINLTLEILGRRADGYHEVRSILMPIGVCDEITLQPAVAGRLDLKVEPVNGVSLEALCPPDKNLAIRAARLLQEECGVDYGATITIRKQIPIGGGLGGGSTDAAAVLVGLNRLWHLGLTKVELAELGGHLGCDIPGLAHGGAVVVGGRGERLEAIKPAKVGAARRFWLVVANPGVTCHTKEIYNRHNGGLTISPVFYHNMLLSIGMGDVFAAARYLFNGLQPVVFDNYPETRRLAERLEDAGALGVLLSGSGASVFALVRDEQHADNVVRRLGSEYWSVKTTTLPDGVMVAHGPLEP